MTGSAPYTCPTCGYHTAFGNRATITLHERVSHGGHDPIVETPATCADRYPHDLDDKPVICDLPPGHDGPHIDHAHSAPATMTWA